MPKYIMTTTTSPQFGPQKRSIVKAKHRLLLFQSVRSIYVTRDILGNTKRKVFQRNQRPDPPSVVPGAGDFKEQVAVDLKLAAYNVGWNYQPEGWNNPM